MEYYIKRPATILADKLQEKIRYKQHLGNSAYYRKKSRKHNMNDPLPTSFFSSSFPTSVSYQVQQLPEEARREFMFTYNEEKKDLAIAYIFHFLFGAAYAYQGKWFKQILFWITFFGFFGIGWVVNILRMPSSIRKQNRQIAERILRGIYRRYSFKKSTQEPTDAMDYIARRAKLAESSLKNAKPRDVRPAYDPVALTVENLEKGFMVDYDFKTWDVVSEVQFDWLNSGSDRCFKLASDTKTMVINLRKDGEHLYVIHFEPVSLYALDSKLEPEIKFRNKPNNIIHYKGTEYYRETAKNGLFFVLKPVSTAKKVSSWEYFDDSREQLIRIENYGKDGIKAFSGKVVSPLDFSDILPNK